MTDTETSHLTFARKLASNSLETRTTAIKKVATFFASAQKELTEADLLKVWMGLFYAMWMSDKPHVQSELAKSIANLIHSHALPANAIMFIRTFYTTMHQRFASVDRLRHDKFLKLVRFFVNNSLKFLKDNDYDAELMDQFFAAQAHVWERDDAQEIQLHICDLFWDECFYACGSELPSEAAFRFAAFFADTLEQTNHAILKARLFEALKAFIAGAAYCSPKLAPKRKTGMETNKDMFPDVEFTNVDLTELEQWLMQRASTRKEILNRDSLYKLRDEALKKKRAEPGFKILPRGSIMKTVAEVEEQEYARLMDEHEKNKTPEDRKEEYEAKLSKKDKKKRKASALESAKEEPATATKKTEKIQKDQEMFNMNAATVPGEGKKANKKHKKIQDEVPAPTKPVESPKTTTTTVTTKKTKKNSAGQVVGSSEETVQTVVTEDAKTKRTEVITTTKEVKKGKKEAPKEEEKPEEVTPKKKQAQAKAKAASVVEQEEVEEPAAKKTKSKASAPVAEQPVETSSKKKSKAKPAPAPVEQESPQPEETSSKKKSPKSTPSPTQQPQQTNGKAAGKRKAPADEDAEVTPNGKAAEKKAKVSPAAVEETNGKAANGTHKAEKGKKGKKQVEEVAEEEEHTPKKGAAVVTPPSTGKKSVRWSKNDVKEFDKTEVVATSPLAPSPSINKLKGVLNTPPRKATPKKIK